MGPGDAVTKNAVVPQLYSYALKLWNRRCGLRSRSGERKKSTKGQGRPGRSMLVVVPQTRPDLYEPLKRSFNGDTKVQVILDRRLNDRRVAFGPHAPERRGSDRRRRSRLDADLKAGSWVAVPVPASLDFGDPDTRAI